MDGNGIVCLNTRRRELGQIDLDALGEQRRGDHENDKQGERDVNKIGEVQVCIQRPAIPSHEPLFASRLYMSSKKSILMRLRRWAEKSYASLSMDRLRFAKALYATSAGIATPIPHTVVMSASAIPGATTLRLAVPLLPMSEKACMMPQTVPSSPRSGQGELVMARVTRER